MKLKENPDFELIKEFLSSIVSIKTLCALSLIFHCYVAACMFPCEHTRLLCAHTTRSSKLVLELDMVLQAMFGAGLNTGAGWGV